MWWVTYLPVNLMHTLWSRFESWHKQASFRAGGQPSHITMPSGGTERENRAIEAQKPKRGFALNSMEIIFTENRCYLKLVI